MPSFGLCGTDVSPDEEDWLGECNDDEKGFHRFQLDEPLKQECEYLLIFLL